MKSRNVMGMIPGTRIRTMSLIFSAHWDHLGRKTVFRVRQDLQRRGG
jgi:hypothetical protein